MVGNAAPTPSGVLHRTKGCWTRILPSGTGSWAGSAGIPLRGRRSWGRITCPQTWWGAPWGPVPFELRRGPRRQPAPHAGPSAGPEQTKPSQRPPRREPTSQRKTEELLTSDHLQGERRFEHEIRRG